MTAAALPQRRGACPGLSAPMDTGDGLLVRLLPIGPVTLAAFAGLCAAARRHGNGVIEVTSRGSLQARGLRRASAPLFAADIAALGIAASDGVPVHCNPLAGLAAEIADAGKLAAELRHAMAQVDFSQKLSPKISIAIDGGGAPGLDDLAADVRLRACLAPERAMFVVAVGGDAQGAATIGTIAPDGAVAAVLRLLDVIARHGRQARARDLVAAEGLTEFRQALASASCGAGAITDVTGRNEFGRAASPIGRHRLRDGSVACGVALAFGHADAHALEALTAAATTAGAVGFRTAPARALLAIGLPPGRADAFTEAAAALGFIVAAGDPRRRVVACAGAPICAAAHIPARALAPAIAEAAAPGNRGVIHISGCAKGCAHAAPAALTVVGTVEGCALIADGTARDLPFAILPAAELSAAVTRFFNRRKAEPAHG